MRVTREVPFIGALSCIDLIPGLLGEALRGREVRMARGGNISFGPLGQSDTRQQEQETDSEN